MKLKSVAVVGASLAGLRAVEALRKCDYEGRLTLFGAEAELPYDRPPLSKEVMTGERAPEDVTFRDLAHFENLGVDLHLGCAVAGLDVADQTILVGEDRFHFDGLIIATGTTPRALKGADGLGGIFTLRTMRDAVAIRKAMHPGSKVVVVGAGFIGSEVASSARAAGLDVVIVEALKVPLAGAVGEEMGQACSLLHGDNGTQLRCGVGVEGFEGTKDVEAVRLTDGSIIETDVVVVGIGVKPATGWLEGSGLEIRDGVVCDQFLAAGPGIYAAGDVARWWNPLFEEEMRVEHWTNAAEQGGLAARNLVAGSKGNPSQSVPYFWSDQYGSRIQFAGRATADEVQVVSGSIDQRRFVALYRRGDRLVGALGLNRSKVLMQYLVQIGQSASWDEAVGFAQGLEIVD